MHPTLTDWEKSRNIIRNQQVHDLRLQPVDGQDDGVHLGIRGHQQLQITMPGGQPLMTATLDLGPFAALAAPA